MITPAEINLKEMDNAMIAQEAKFESLIEQIRNAFYDLPAPESAAFKKLEHVRSAEHVNNELRDILQFLTR